MDKSAKVIIWIVVIVVLMFGYFIFSDREPVSATEPTFTNLSKNEPDAESSIQKLSDGNESGNEASSKSTNGTVDHGVENTTEQPEEVVLCVVGPVPAVLRKEPYSLSNFYQKYCNFYGLPIVSSGIVADEALQQAWQTIHQLTLHRRDEILIRLAEFQIRVTIMASSEVTTDIPEHSDLDSSYWDDRARGLGAVPARPAVSGAEENLLCQREDRYANEDIFLHEFAHTVHTLGLDSGFSLRLSNLYDVTGRELWSGTYAAENIAEYWAEGTQSWFNVNAEADPPNGIHNPINTREELKVFDPDLYALLAEVYSEELIADYSCH